jgi:outer membrane receptor protein involved in Fe transport
LGHLKLAATGLLLVSVATTGWAQDPDFDEMVVSVRKRDENLQEVPISVGVFDEEQLKKLNIANLESVSKWDTSVTFDQGFASQDTRITIRGLHPTRGRQNVAVLVDGIDVTGLAVQTNGGSLLMNPRLFDMERVEIVKGPQNALYGRAAFNGAINYVTKKPSDEFDGNVYADIGSNSHYDIRGALSGPIIGDALLGGVTLATWSDDGFYSNSVTGGGVGGTQGYGAAAAVTWNVTDNFAADLRLEYTDDEFDQAPYTSIIPTVPAPIPDSAIAGNVIAPSVTTIDAVRGVIPDGDTFQVTLSEDPRTGRDYPGVDREIFRTALTLDWEFSAVTLVSLTGYTDSTVDSFEDARREGSVAAAGKTTGGEFLANDETNQFSQDLRLQSNGNERFDWVVGALYWEENVDFTDGSLNCVANATFVPFPPPGFFAPGVNCADPMAAISGAARYPDLWTRDQEHWSVYALIDWEFIDNWSVILEGRYSDEKITVSGPDRAAIGAPFAPGSRPARPRAIDPRGIFFPSSIMAAYGTLSDSVTDDFFAPKATLQWNSSDTKMWYLSVAQSFKPAGVAISGNLSGFNPDSSRFEQEELTVYEFGGKTSWADDRLIVNGALFFQDFSDKQVTSQKADASGFLFPAPVNAASAEIYGFELDGNWQATDDLQLFASWTYLDSEYKDYSQLSQGPAPIADAGNCTVVDPDSDPATKNFCDLNLSGRELEFVPKHSVIAGLSWQREVVRDIDFLFEMNYLFQDDRFTSAFNQQILPSYSQWDFRLGWTSNAWSIIGYVDNAFEDSKVKSTFANTYNQGISTAAPPFTFVLPLNQTPILPPGRSFGLRMSYRFGAGAN